MPKKRNKQRSTERVVPPSTTLGAARPSDAVEYANIGMMVVALVIAALVPFELFLVAYAVLGPLHYLTEISWLHDRKFFTPRRADWAPLVVCGLFITLGNDAVLGAAGRQWLDGISWGDSNVYRILKSLGADVTFLAFGIALILIVTERFVSRLVGFALVGICAVLGHVTAPQPATGLYYKLFGIYLPTLIHVFIFTGAFILAGALKRNSRAGLLSFAVFLVCGALAIGLPDLSTASRTGAPAIFWRGFPELALAGLNDLLRQTPESLVGVNVFTSGVVLRLVRFLAFAYTYHYLNWFSKTSIIQWHAAPPARLAVIALAWLASLALYAISYDLGLRWLFLLSLTHVLLEFPLNHKCFLEIGRELRRRLVAA